jgi:hypothetical protein
VGDQDPAVGDSPASGKRVVPARIGEVHWQPRQTRGKCHAPMQAVAATGCSGQRVARKWTVCGGPWEPVTQAGPRRIFFVLVANRGILLFSALTNVRACEAMRRVVAQVHSIVEGQGTSSALHSFKMGNGASFKPPWLRSDGERPALRCGAPFRSMKCACASVGPGPRGCPDLRAGSSEGWPNGIGQNVQISWLFTEFRIPRCREMGEGVRAGRWSGGKSLAFRGSGDSGRNLSVLRALPVG